MSRLAPFLRRWIVPAVSGIRMYWATALLIAATGAAALVTLVPLASLWTPEHGLLSTRLGFSTVAATDVGIPWAPLTRAPAVSQERAVAALFRLLFSTGIATLATAALTILTLSAARASSRAPEIAIRRSVGASRKSLHGATLLEGLTIAVTVVLIGVFAGRAVAGVAVSAWPGSLTAASVESTAPLVLAIAAVIMLGGILPIVFARRTRISDAHAEPLPLLVPTLQLGLSLMVLTGGALIATHAASLTRTGASRSGAGEVFQVSMKTESPAQRAGQYAALLEVLAGDSGMPAVSLTSPGMVQGLGTTGGITTDCGYCAEGGIYVPLHLQMATHQMVSADTFRALGVPILEGRGISSADRWDTPRVAVVSRTLAALHFQNGQAVGRQLQVGLDKSDWYTVVGVADDRRLAGFGAAFQPRFTVYLSVLQHPPQSVDLLVSGRPDPRRETELRTALASLGAPSVRRVSEASILAAEQAPLSWFGRAFALIGWATLLIAAVGIFSLMRLWVLSLRMELGLRRSVGARRRHLYAYILSRAGLVGLGGVAVGIWFGPALWDTLADVVAGLPPWDGTVLARFAMILVATAVAGALVPAARAAHSSPSSLIESGEG